MIELGYQIWRDMIIRILDIEKIEDNKILVSWEYSSKNKTILSNLSIDNSGICKTVGVDIESGSAEIADLLVDAIYEIQLKVLNKNGWYLSEKAEIAL